MDEAPRKSQIQQTVNTVAEGYGTTGMGFFHNAAAHLPQIFKLRGDEHLPDAATATGNAVAALAPYLLSDAETWWRRIWYAGFCGQVAQLDETQLVQFKREHLRKSQRRSPLRAVESSNNNVQCPESKSSREVSTSRWIKNAI